MSPGESRPLDDGELVMRAQKGDVAAYEALVCRHQETAFWTAHHMTRDSESAKDASQSGFIKAYYALNRFRSGKEFRPWLLRIVANEARNLARSAGRRTKYELLLAEGRPRDDAAPSPEVATLARLDRERLLGAVNGLSEKDRRVIACRYFLELSEAETAEVLDCSRGTVKSRLSRALARLRESLALESPDFAEGAQGE